MPRSPTSTTRLDAEAILELLDLRAQRRRVGRVAVEHLDRDRQPLARAQQSVHAVHFPGCRRAVIHNCISTTSTSYRRPRGPAPCHGSLRFLHNIVRFPAAESWSSHSFLRFLHDCHNRTAVGMLLSARRPDVAHITSSTVPLPPISRPAPGLALLNHCIRHLTSPSYSHDSSHCHRSQPPGRQALPRTSVSSSASVSTPGRVLNEGICPKP